MKTARDIITTIGRDRIQVALGLSKSAVDKAWSKEEIPALWFDALERLAGQPLPRQAFSFHGVSE